MAAMAASPVSSVDEAMLAAVQRSLRLGHLVRSLLLLATFLARDIHGRLMQAT